MNKQLNPATVAGALKVVDSNGAIVAGTTQLTGGGQTIVFTPLAPLAAGTTAITLNSSVTDLAGDPAFTYQANFITAPVPTSQPLEITEYSWNGFQPTNVVLQMEFNQPLDPSTVIASNFSLYPAIVGGNVPITVSLLNGNVVQIKPNSNLTPNIEWDLLTSQNLKGANGATFDTQPLGAFNIVSGPGHQPAAGSRHVAPMAARTWATTRPSRCTSANMSTRFPSTTPRW